MRKGQLFGKTVVALVLVASIAVLLGLAGFLSEKTNEEIMLKSKAVRGISTSMEKVMNAPCLTERRGVFKKSVIESSGDSLSCINIEEAMIGINVGMEGTCFQESSSSDSCQYFEISKEGSDVKVEETTKDNFVSLLEGEDEKPNLQYPVSILDEKDNSRKMGAVRVVLG